LHLAHLADMTRLYEPIDVVAHKGPPIAEGNMCMCSEVSVVSCIVVRQRQYKESTVLCDNKLMLAFAIFVPELIGIDKELCTVAKEGLVLRVAHSQWSKQISVPFLY